MEGLIDKEIYFIKKKKLKKKLMNWTKRWIWRVKHKSVSFKRLKIWIETIKDKLNHWRDMSDTLIKELIYKIVVYSKEKLDIYINVASYQKNKLWKWGVCVTECEWNGMMPVLSWQKILQEVMKNLFRWWWKSKSFKT